MEKFAAGELSELFVAPYVIWGTGRVAQAFYRTYCAPEGKMPLFWVDSDAAKHGSRITGVEVVAPETFYRRSEDVYAEGGRPSVVIGATDAETLFHSL